VDAAVAGSAYRALSLWHDTAPDGFAPRPALAGDLHVDVAIVGAGLTGLWAAYYLASADPALRIAVLEREVAGFGASGRNGGWCSALFPSSLRTVARRYGAAAATLMYAALRDSVDEVGRVVAAEGLDVHWAKGGSVALARSAPQLERARAAVAEAGEFGFGKGDIRLLDPAEASGMVGATGVLGGTYTPHCAALHPGRLVRGLANVAERLGVRLYERTPVRHIAAGRADTRYGAVFADVVVRATEGYTAALPGLRRMVAPVYSLMVATEPLPAAFWDGVGLRRRETFTDFRHLIIYGQRTADDRFAFGGRGAPYHLGSRVRTTYDREPAVFAELRRVLVDLFPAVRDAAVTHTWGGPLGVPRDWFPSVGLDRRSGLAWAGGYVGDGVTATNLAGRTLADLVLERESDLVHLPWGNHRSPRWEPEPLRWLGVNAGLRAMTSADAVEARTGRPARRARVAGRFVGH